MKCLGLEHTVHRLGEPIQKPVKRVTFSSLKILLRGGTWKSGPGVKSSIFSANIRPTETYYIPNQWKLIKVFDELCRFKITAFIE